MVVSKKQLIKATYGKSKDKLIDVTSIIKKHMNSSFIVNNNLFNCDPEIRIKKELIMYLSDNTLIIIPENGKYDPMNLNIIKNDIELNKSYVLFKNVIPNKLFTSYIITKINYDNYKKYYNKYKYNNNSTYPLINYDFIKDFALFMDLNIIKLYNIDYNIAKDTIILLYYSENYNCNNFLLGPIKNKEIHSFFNSYIILKILFESLKNIKWHYLVYTNDDIIIEDVLFINNLFTIYKIKPVNSNYCIFKNNNNQSTDIVWITTHQKLFITNIYTVLPIHRYIKQSSITHNNVAYVLTINNQKYNNFLLNAKNIDMTFIKYIGIDKNDLSINICKGHLACLFGHYMILKTFFKSDNILILEDDNYFTDNFNERWKNIKTYLDNNPDEWDIFNGNTAFTIYPYDLIVVNNEKLVKFTNNTKTNFIYYNKKIIPRFIEYFENFYYKLINNILNCDWIIDRFLRVFKCITAVPFITNEITGSISSINDTVQNYTQVSLDNQSEIIKIINLLLTETGK